MSDDYKALYQQKCEEYRELNDQFQVQLEQCTKIMTSLEKQVAELSKKNENLVKELSDLKKNKISTLSALQRQLDHLKKEKKQFQDQFHKFQKRVVELEILNESLENQNRASKSMLNTFQDRVARTMQDLAFVQTELEQNKNNNQEMITRLKNQLKQTQQELYVVHLKHQKHNSESQHRRSRRESAASFDSQDDKVAHIQMNIKVPDISENVGTLDFKKNKDVTFQKTINLVNNLIGQLDVRVIKIRSQKKKFVLSK